MLTSLMKTSNDSASLVLRVMLGLVFFPHGAQKALGWFGGYGLQGTLGFFTHTLGVPMVFAVLAIAAEFLGAIGLIAGLLTRVAAFGIACNMLVAIYMVHLPNGFFMNWTGKQAGEGYEYHLLVIAMAIALMIKGGGRWSLDHALSARRD